MVNIFCFISFPTAVGEKSVGLNLQEQGVYVPVKWKKCSLVFEWIESWQLSLKAEYSD